MDHQAQGIIKMPLTVARYAGHPDLFDRVTDVVEVIHRSDPSLESSKLLAVILEKILLSGGILYMLLYVCMYVMEYQVFIFTHYLSIFL